MCLKINRLTNALQRVPSLRCGIQDLIHLGSRYIFGVNPAYTFPIQVNLEHDLCRRFQILAKKLLNHDNNKLHRRVVIIEHDDLVHLRWLNLLGSPFKHNGVAITPVRLLNR